MPKKKTEKKNSIEEGIENFAEEMGAIGKKVERYFDGDHKHKERHHSAFGLFGPFLSSLLGIIILAIIIWFLGFINTWLGSDFLLNLHFFLFKNLGFFFVISLFFSYTNYYSKKYSPKYEIVAPVVAAIGIAIGFWVAGNILSIANISLSIPVLNTVANLMMNSVFWVLGLVIFIGYVVILIKLITKMPTYTRRDVVVKKTEKTKNAETKRVYRSGKDKILGGVCGGIAEYLGIDPVLIRLLWIASFFAFGTGVLIYIIAWIIIPRNPNHKWND